ncbi:sporulation YhaL family protein [Bacillus solimangrovi]|uniref:SigE-dependent sporulation protein n=1 Tax=Bacillus solimangrovi TaxID=1305675 RepID=A0A1E5LFQ9_9BACI|nr:sporulation YhaL family protein [Bacillus solimangrovi]OEH92925.1 SigE-dependent sporulation protein [Bacillus solimangrovi]
MEALPWWIYLVTIGIAYSGYMTIKTTKKDEEIDQQFIEREGEVYIKRMEREREKRRKEQSVKL